MVPSDVLCGKIGFNIEARNVVGMYGLSIVAETKIMDTGNTWRELLGSLLCRRWKAIIVYEWPMQCVASWMLTLTNH